MYTKGEWTIRIIDSNNVWIAFEDSEPGIEIYSPYDGEALANANLIAASPMLYEALEDIGKAWSFDPQLPEYIKATEALLKAEGKEKKC